MNCELKFLGSSNGVFYSGKDLEGTVELNLTEPVKIEEIICKFIGYAKCEWTIEFSKYNIQSSTSRIDYLDETLKIIEPTEEGIELSTGVHHFDFTFPLPPSLPTTFKSKYGSIKYKMKVDVKFFESPESELNFELPFTVICPSDLNTFTPSLAEPVRAEIEKNFNFKIAPSDLLMTVVIPQGGYVIGQSIEVLIQIENLGRTRMKYLKIALRKIVVYTSLKPKRSEKKHSSNEVKEILYQEVPPKMKRDFIRRIVVPPLPPNIKNCEIINIRYELRVKAKTIGWNKSPRLKIPLEIGTVAIKNESSEVDGVFVGDPPPYTEVINRSSIETTDTSSEED